MTLSLVFWGTRGSIPSPGPSTVRYGGNTPCVELRTDDGRLAILDAGTGIRELGRYLANGGGGNGVQADIFITHTHWDHIQGLPFFAPLFQPGNRFTIWGSRAIEAGIDQVVRAQMSPVVFPVSFDDLGADVDFEQVDEGEYDAGGMRVSSMQVRHPGGALGFRFASRNAPDRALVYVSDSELDAAVPYPLDAGWRERFVAFARGAKVLVHDAMYTAAEYDRHRGWGHSTFDDAVLVALEAGVERLVLFHHKPERSDEELDRCVEGARDLVRRHGGGLEIVAAAEGLALAV